MTATLAPLPTCQDSREAAARTEIFVNLLPLLPEDYATHAPTHRATVDGVTIETTAHGYTVVGPDGHTAASSAADAVTVAEFMRHRGTVHAIRTMAMPTDDYPYRAQVSDGLRGQYVMTDIPHALHLAARVPSARSAVAGFISRAEAMQMHAYSA